MLARPKRSDDEDEILKQQEEFLKNKSLKPAATVINKRKGSESTSTSASEESNPASSYKKSKSKFAIERERKALAAGIEPTNHPPVALGLLGEIKENFFDSTVALSPSFLNHEGFPQVFRRDVSLQGTERSIFAQQIDKSNVHNLTKPFHDLKFHEESSHSTVDPTETFGARSFVLSGPEAATLHEENVGKLAQLSAEEIKAEREKLVAELDPKVLEFLKSRRTAKQSVKNVPAKMGENQTSDQLTNDGLTKIGHVEDRSQQESRMDVDPSDVTSSSEAHYRPEVRAAEKPDVSVPKVRLPFSGDQMDSFIHMNIVEEEKLLWTTDLPAPKARPDKDSFAARFDFQGMLLPYEDESVSVTRGLHHHGEEPERPGYTLHELLLLGRSDVMQQRVLSLVTTANILSKTKLGYYDGCFEPPLLEQMLGRDLYLFLRFSLDDVSPPVVVAAVYAMQNLLCNKADEVCLDRMLGCSGALYQPSLDVEGATKEQEGEMKDHEMLQMDLIKGALRTDILARLRYILDKLRPGPKTVIAVLDILIRIARHSYASALSIMNCCGLVVFIVDNFVTVNWQPLACPGVEPESLYGLPVVQALRLLRVIACRSRRLATDIAVKHCIMDRVVIYVTITQQTGLDTKCRDILQINLESFYLWQTLMSYNLATQYFNALSPVLAGLMHYHHNCTGVDVRTSTFDLEHCTALTSLVETALTVADYQAAELAHQRATRSTERLADSIETDHLIPFVPSLNGCLTKWLTQMRGGDGFTVTLSTMKMMFAAFSCLSTFYSKYLTNKQVDVVGIMESIETLDEKCLRPLLSADGVFDTEIASSLERCSSLLLDAKTAGFKRDPSNLPSLLSLLRGGLPTPVVDRGSPLLFMLGLTRYLIATHAVHRGLDRQCLTLLLANRHVMHLVKLVTSRQHHPLVGNCFAVYETRLLTDLVRLACIDHNESTQRGPVYYPLAIKLVSMLQSEDGLVLRDLLRDVVFNPGFVGQATGINPNTLQQSAQDQLLQASINNLPQIWQCYDKALGLYLVPRTALTRLTLTVETYEPALPVDWTYLPILGLTASQSATSVQVGQVTCCLGWSLIGERFKDVAMKRMSVTARYCRVAAVFLAGCDLFLDPTVRNYMREILVRLLEERETLDFSATVPGLTSFYDLYTQLLEQFASVSYGDEVFGQYLLPPLCQGQDVSFRRQVWSEHAAVLRVLSVPLERLLFPLHLLLAPTETDCRLLMIYFQYLAKGLVRERWSPVLYRIALHHVATFVTETHEKKEMVDCQAELREGIRKLGNVELKSILENYSVSHTSPEEMEVS